MERRGPCGWWYVLPTSLKDLADTFSVFPVTITYTSPTVRFGKFVVLTDIPWIDFNRLGQICIGRNLDNGEFLGCRIFQDDGFYGEDLLIEGDDNWQEVVVTMVDAGLAGDHLEMEIFTMRKVSFFNVVN